MDIEAARDHCLSLPESTEGFPFGPDVLVFKVAGKMFALLSFEAIPPSMNVKCDPERAIELRAQYPAVTPGYHMSKKHWNTVTLDGTVPSDVVRSFIDDSWRLVASKLKKADRVRLGLV